MRQGLCYSAHVREEYWAKMKHDETQFVYHPCYPKHAKTPTRSTRKSEPISPAICTWKVEKRGRSSKLRWSKGPDERIETASSAVLLDILGDFGWLQFKNKPPSFNDIYLYLNTYLITYKLSHISHYHARHARDMHASICIVPFCIPFAAGAFQDHQLTLYKEALLT